MLQYEYKIIFICNTSETKEPSFPLDRAVFRAKSAPPERRPEDLSARRGPAAVMI